jgi:Xaa-Pro aminopeptidase
MKGLFNFLPNEVDAFLLSTEDEFLGEYTPDCLKRLEFLTRFTGSFAYTLIKKDGKSILFIDGRYTIQAQQEAGLNFEIQNIKDLTTHLKGVKFALDENTHSYQFVQSLKDKELNFITVNGSPVDEIWKRDIKVSRETFPFEFAGETSEAKLSKLTEYVKSEGADAIFVSDPHDVCYLFNIRGNYLKHSPVVPCFAIVSRETQTIVFKEQIQSLKYGKVLVSKNIPFGIFNILSQNNTIIIEKSNFLQKQKSIKTEFEIECIKKAHIEDAKALKLFGEWLKKTDLKQETEYTIGEKLLEFRKEQKSFACESFPAIVGFKENGAIVHYRAKKETAKTIQGMGLLLVDSGGQYYDKENGICGTTDVTRVFAIGEPNEKEKRAYTLVLKGHIALASAIFPLGTTGAMLDVLARQFLWKEGLNYSHGTGHGVGYYLSVHEGPCGISSNYHTELAEGMVLSNEPGFYEEGEFGVRFESLMLVKKSSMQGFLEFEVLTKAPVEPLLLDTEILTDFEIEWLTKYSTSMR